MKKISVFFALCLMLFVTVNAHAHQAVKTDGFALAEDGVKFDALIIAMEPKNRLGSLFFQPNKPSAKPVGEKNTLAAANTVAALKAEIVKVVNAKLDRDPLTNYTAISVHDVHVYGGHALQMENSYTDSKVLQASPAGSIYRVKILLTPKDPKNTIQTAIQGIFTLSAQQ